MNFDFLNLCQYDKMKFFGIKFLCNKNVTLRRSWDFKLIDSDIIT